MKRVILESPYAGDLDGNRQYAQRAARCCAIQGESVLASHLLFPQFLDEQDPAERKLGIELGLAWLPFADYSVFFTDRGWSNGMIAALSHCIGLKRQFFLRSLDNPIKVPPADQTIEFNEIGWPCDMELGISK